VIDALASISASSVDANATLRELKAYLVLYPDDVVIGEVSLLNSASPGEGEILRARVHMIFYEEYLNQLASMLADGEVFRVFGENVSITAEMNGLDFSFNLTRTVLIEVVVDFIADYSFKVLDINVKPPGNIALIDVKVNVKLTGGPNAPITLLSGVFDVIGGGGKVGVGSFEGPYQVSGESFTVRVLARLEFTSGGAQWFASNLVSYGRLNVTVSNLIVHVKIYNLTIDYKMPSRSYVYVTDPVVIEVIDVRLTAVELIPPTVYAEADVKITNPFNFSVTIVPMGDGKPSIRFDVYCSEHHVYLGYGEYYGSFTVSANEEYIIYSIPVTITNPGHIISSHYDGSKVRMYVDVLNGKAGAKLYETYFTFKFQRKHIYVEWPSGSTASTASSYTITSHILCACVRITASPIEKRLYTISSLV